MSRRHVAPDPPADPVATAVRQAARERRKGRHRKSMLLLKRAAFEAQQRPGLWARYAFTCMGCGKVDEGRKAFAQAAWLHERTGHERTAQLTRELGELAATGTLPPPYRR